MFTILDKSGKAVETATSFPEATRVIDHLDRRNKVAGPHIAQAA